MTRENATILAIAIANLGAKNDETALMAARAAAKLIAAEGVKQSAFAAAIIATLTNMKPKAEPESFAELGRRGARSRMAEIARQSTVTDNDRARIGALRERFLEARHAELAADEVAWLDALWEASPRARAREAG
ncbi:hypothetical protein GXW78_25610 [Roseomonas terrae]|jgi:hypothetical protein|uniref:Uncharacterized protein n=1 Tax=Neoroseomonas terrae TaxID=424799 RepID=A0ABS5EPU3_9PROT|nr:hypothetical protein [Neoroseomonas terrae]MBR0653059.1 hypothetical protein [Neoroseomonas terrae]